MNSSSGKSQSVARWAKYHVANTNDAYNEENGLIHAPPTLEEKCLHDYTDMNGNKANVT